MKSNHYTMKARNAIKKSLSSVNSDSPIAIGCSGGADSLALLIGLSTLYKNDASQLVHVVIVDHQLQKETANISLETAEKAKAFGFNAHIINVDIEHTSEGMESDARKARYDAFESIINQYGIAAFLIGHTMTDQAEQVFLGLLRGSGTRSIAGIRENRDFYKRPFLNSLSRKETQNVCNENNMNYWCDPHNDSLEYKRVSVRKLISATEKATGQDIVYPLVKTAQISSEDADALDFYADIAYNDVEKSLWSVSSLERLPKAIRKRIYRKKLIFLGAKTDAVTFEITNRIDDLILNWKGQGMVSVSNGLTVGRKNNCLLFNK